jgi:pimeloyl-ACP methyl ester carboxylesterase
MPTVRTNDIETYYERRGEGPPVVFVHGAIVDHSQWDPQLDALSGDYTTVAYDVRGHGRTGGHASNLDNPDFFTGAVRELLAEVYPAETAEAAI